MEIGLLQMRIKVSFAGPVLVKHEDRGIIECLVEIIVDAPRVFAAGSNE